MFLLVMRNRYTVIVSDYRFQCVRSSFNALYFNSVLGCHIIFRYKYDISNIHSDLELCKTKYYFITMWNYNKSIILSFII